MARSTKEGWLTGPGDLEEAEVSDVPQKGQTVKVRGLPATYSNRAASKAMVATTTPKGDQTYTVNTEVMEILQFAYGCVEPKFTEDEARIVAEKYGPAFKRVVAKIDELSGVDKEAIERAEARFPGGGTGSPRADLGDADADGGGGSDVPPRAGARAGDSGR
jgi:hypothetical protein